MKKAILTIGLFSLIMVLTSFTTPEMAIVVRGGGNTIVNLNGAQAAGGNQKVDLNGAQAAGGNKKID